MKLRNNTTPHNKETERYNIVLNMLRAGPIKVNEVAKELGCNVHSLETLLGNLSLSYPIWNPSRGVWKLLDDNDFIIYREKIKNERTRKKREKN